ncbi:hypothetical protein [Pediococcus claussenii]|nr:hypothetical protein [Pediococcus claussenii]
MAKDVNPRKPLKTLGGMLIAAGLIGLFIYRKSIKEVLNDAN